VIGLGLILGCCSQSGGDVEEKKGAPLALVEVYALLHAGGANGQPATQLSDFDKHRSRSPQGYAAVKNGDIIVVWGVRPMGEGAIAKGEQQEVAAYEKSVPTSGGFVLLSGGTIKKMTADAFEAAMKSGKP
jgi:hypothetical protein